MILVWLLGILVAGGLLALVVGRWSALWARWTALTALGIDLLLMLGLWRRGSGGVPTGSTDWIVEVSAPWIPNLGIAFHLAADGLSLVLIFLTLVLGMVAVVASWREIQQRVGLFHFNVLWVLAGVAGVFLAIDLFLFYFFWELMLVPMYFLIGIWGHERRVYAAVKFFLFTQASGLLMLVAILALVFTHYRTTGTVTFDYEQLLGTSMSTTAALWMMLGFFVAFAVKLPVVPFHTWLPDAHTEAPTAGSLILAGLLLKTGAYGLIRFVVPLFPEASATFAPVAMTLGTVGILYGAKLAFAQTDLKRLIAYTSVSHLGFVLLGVFAWNTLALQGVVAQMVCHGLSTGGLFLLAGMLQERMHTRDLRAMGGLADRLPRMNTAAIVLAMASLGLPGLGNFVAEVLILIGAFQANVPVTVVATIGLILATIYALWIVQQAFHGENVRDWKLPDLGVRETIIISVVVLPLVWLGVYPQPVIDAVRPALTAVQQLAS